MQHQSSGRLSSFVNRPPKASRGDGEDSLYAFGSVAWEPTRQNSNRFKKPVLYHPSKNSVSTNSTASSSSTSGTNYKKPFAHDLNAGKKKLRRHPKPELPKEQQQIADEIRDFLHREKSLLRPGNDSKPNSPRKQRNTLGTALINLPSTPKSTGPKKKKKKRIPGMVPASPSHTRSMRSQRSVPMIVPNVPLVSPYSARSSPSGAIRKDDFANFHMPRVAPMGGGGGGYESDRVRSSKTDKYENEDAPCQKNYFSDADASASDDSCLFSDYFSETEHDEEDDQGEEGSSASRRSSFSWNVFAKSRSQRRHQRLRAPSPDAQEEGDVSNLLGGSILNRHGV